MRENPANEVDHSFEKAIPDSLQEGMAALDKALKRLAVAAAAEGNARVLALETELAELKSRHERLQEDYRHLQAAYARVEEERRRAGERLSLTIERLRAAFELVEDEAAAERNAALADSVKQGA